MSRRNTRVGSARMPLCLALVFVAGFPPMLARAQVPVPTAVTGELSTDSIPSFERPNGALLRTGVLTYALALMGPTGDPTPLGTRVVSVSELSVGGNPSWLIAESRTGTVVETTDSVSLARVDLAPERWLATIGKSRFAASFTRDSMFGGMETYQGRASFGVAIPSNALLSAGMAERIVEMLPLREGYRARASLVLVDGQSPQIVRSEIVVDGTETLTVGRQAVECWRVLLRTAATEERLWVAREGARVVRIEQWVTGGVLRADLQP
ncbi:MAG: hypothetical protein M3Z05_19735 [Gemmatimonadota bacterium]|nr:hypothetical protein [Gemmatimonadota bacterium]